MKKQIIISILFTLVAMTGQAQEVFFHTDSALIRGRIADYSSAMGFQMLSAQIDDLFMGEHQVVSAEIHKDGTFEKRLLLHHPVYNWFFTSTENIGKKQVPFYVCPGDTLDITITFNGKDIPDCTYSGGHAKDVARLLQVRTEYLDTYGQCLSFTGDIPAYNHWADSVYTARLHEVEECATQHGFTPFEHQLMLCDVSANFGVSYLAYFSQMKTKLMQSDPSAEHKAGNAVMERLSQASHYEVLRRLPNDNPLMMASMYYPLYMNKLQFAAPLRYPLMVKRGGLMDDSKEEVEEDLNHFKTQGHQMFASDYDVLPVQILQLQRINEAVGAWMDEGKAEENFNALLPYISHPQIKEIGLQCFRETMSMGIAFPLSEGPTADFVREILATYPGRYIVLDFWAMWCAPCKKEITDTKDFRRRLRERSDIKFVFLANETHPERKDYQDFVRTNLDGEHNIVIDDNRFRQMQDLFGFNAIPFNVTLTPDGRIVRDGLLLRGGEAGYDLFVKVLEEIKAKTGTAQIRYRLEGTIGDSTLNTRLLLCQQMAAMKMANAPIDTLEIVGGKLIPTEGTLDEAGSFCLQSIAENGGMPDFFSPIFIIEDGTIRIHFNPEKEEYIAPDTPLNKALGEFNNAFVPLLHGDSIKQQRLDSLMRSELSRHGDDVLGMQALAFVISHVNPPAVASWLDLMSPRVKAGNTWNEMKTALTAMGVNMEMEPPNFVPAIGEKFVDFAVEYDGKTTRLSDYVGRGQYVLADFWASWCGPCRMEIPEIIAAYNKYKDRGLQVIGIAVEDKPENTLKAIENDGVPYPQIINTQKIATDAYHIRGIPHIILFAPDGTILARGLRGEEIDRKLEEIFPENK